MARRRHESRQSLSHHFNNKQASGMQLRCKMQGVFWHHTCCSRIPPRLLFRSSHTKTRKGFCSHCVNITNLAIEVTVIRVPLSVICSKVLSVSPVGLCPPAVHSELGRQYCPLLKDASGWWPGQLLWTSCCSEQTSTLCSVLGSFHTKPHSHTTVGRSWPWPPLQSNLLEDPPSACLGLSTH